MMLDISAALRNPGSAIPFEHEEPLAETEVLGEKVTFPEPAVIAGTYSLVDEALLIKGRLKATASAACARCLKAVDYPVSVPFEESFLRVDPRTSLQEDPWEERLVFSGNRVDLSHLALTLALLELPLRFLCSQSCKGIAEPAGEMPPTQEETLDDAHPMGALRQLFTKLQEE